MQTKSLIFIVSYVIAWSALIYGSLKIASLPIQSVHSFCGPWGCAAEPNVLISVHAIWASLIVPFGILIIWASNLARVPPLWKMASLITALILITFVGIDLFDYYYYYGGETKFAFKRGMFRLVTSIDFPIVQLTLAACLNWILCNSVLIYRPEKCPDTNCLPRTMCKEKKSDSTV